MSYSVQWNEASPEEDAASAASLALAPWVREQAEPLKAAHMEARRGESEETTLAKASRWRRGIGSVQGGHHKR